MSGLAEAIDSECTLYLWKRPYDNPSELHPTCKKCCVAHCPSKVRERYCPFMIEMLERLLIETNLECDDD
jgi:hypothetical protein